MLRKASEIKTKSLQVIGDIDEAINDWLAKNDDLTIIDIKISETTVLIVFQDNNHLMITRPEVSI